MQNNNINSNGQIPIIDFDKAWAGLKPALDAEAKRREKRKRRFIIFWFTLLAICIGGGIFIGNKQLKTNNEQKAIADQVSVSNKKQLSYDTKVIDIDRNRDVKERLVEDKNVRFTGKDDKIEDKSEVAIGKRDKVVEKNKELVSNSKKGITESKKVVAKSKKGIADNKKGITKREKGIAESEKGIADNMKIVSNNKPIETVRNENITTNSHYTKSTNTDSLLVQKDSNNTNISTTIANTAVTNTVANKAKTTAINKQQQWHYGLQWNMPLLQGVNYLDINTQNQPTTLLIPTLWIKKAFGKKHSVALQINPYAQYYLNNKAQLSYDIYTISIQSGSQLDTKPQDIIYTETINYNKTISIEASLIYTYQISNKLQIGLGMGNNWLQGALMQNKVVRNNNQITRDSLYGINKQDKEWNNLKPTFLVGKLQAEYQLSRFNVGISFSKAVGNVFGQNVVNKTPINTNLFIKWNIK
jgi:hypothetical protein